MLTEAFMQRALLAALFLCPLCALLGVFVTARRMAFFGETIAHGALAGVAIGIGLGLASTTPTVIFFSFLMAITLLWLKEKTELMTDSIMALLLSSSISIGVIAMGLMRGNYQGEVHRILFGDILAVGTQDVILAGAMFFGIGGWVFYQLSPLTLITVQEDLAHTSSVRVRRMNYLFILALTLTVAMSVRLVGILLVTPMLVIPAAAARNISRNLRQQILASLLTAVIAGLFGITLSYELDVPCGPTIVLTCTSLFALTLVLGKLFRRAQKRASAA